MKIFHLVFLLFIILSSCSVNKNTRIAIDPWLVENSKLPNLINANKNKESFEAECKDIKFENSNEFNVEGEWFSFDRINTNDLAGSKITFFKSENKTLNVEFDSKFYNSSTYFSRRTCNFELSKVIFNLPLKEAFHVEWQPEFFTFMYLIKYGDEYFLISSDGIEKYLKTVNNLKENGVKLNGCSIYIISNLYFRKNSKFIKSLNKGN